jgi:hypothetical protein
MLSLPLVDVLKNRGISDLDRFLAPSSWSDLPSPFELEEMEPAVTQILDAIRSQRPMTIVGEYDCDGVFSTAILEATLPRLGVQPTVYLPHRDEGMALAMRWCTAPIITEMIGPVYFERPRNRLFYTKVTMIFRKVLLTSFVFNVFFISGCHV